MTFHLKNVIRQHIIDLKPYSSARDEYAGTEGVFLDANENSYGTPGLSGQQIQFHRYPDPLQVQLKQRIAEIKEVAPDQIFLGNGSDEAIDLLIRAFCDPGKDNIVIHIPTYGMYEVAAAINQVEVRKAALTPDYQLDEANLETAVNEKTKIIFFCSPNNPTGNILSARSMLGWAKRFEGLIVVDEAYIDFADAPGLLEVLEDYPNLVVLQTFSKAWGMAALRLGLAFASPEIIKILNKIKPPYNINGLTQQKALEVLEHPNQKEQIVQEILEQREKLGRELRQLPVVENVYPSDANFLLVRVKDAFPLFHHLIAEHVIVRDRSKVALCEGCLRITVGTPQENQVLLKKIKEFSAWNKQ